MKIIEEKDGAKKSKTLPKTLRGRFRGMFFNVNWKLYCNQIGYQYDRAGLVDFML